MPHLGALRDAGLAAAHRVGRYVLYARMTAGEALIAAAGPPAPRPAEGNVGLP